MSFAAILVLDVLNVMRSHGIEAWIDGGWGVDALLGGNFRDHDDLDLVISIEWIDRAEHALTTLGFSQDAQATNLPTRRVLRNADGLSIDIHPVTFKPDGAAEHVDTIHGTLDYAPYIFSANGFAGKGKVGGQEVRCMSAAEHIRQKVLRRYSPWLPHRLRDSGLSSDLVDVIALQQAFGSAPSGDFSVEAVRNGAEAYEVDFYAMAFFRKHVPELNMAHSCMKEEIRLRNRSECRKGEIFLGKEISADTAAALYIGPRNSNRPIENLTTKGADWRNPQDAQNEPRKKRRIKRLFKSLMRSFRAKN